MSKIKRQESKEKVFFTYSLHIAITLMSTKRKPKHSHQKRKMNTHNGRINVNNYYMKRWSNQGNAVSNEISLFIYQIGKN